MSRFTQTLLPRSGLKLPGKQSNSPNTGPLFERSSVAAGSISGVVFTESDQLITQNSFHIYRVIYACLPKGWVTTCTIQEEVL